MDPAHAILDKLLYLRSQLRLMQTEIIHGPNSEKVLALESFADTVHERAARGTEVVRHELAGFHGFIFGERFEVLCVN